MVVSVEKLILKKCRCKSQFCKDCSLSHCVGWRERLRPALRSWRSVMMLTLTVNRVDWDNPEDAWRDVGKNRKISELMRALKYHGAVRHRGYTCTLELHKDGWPHWHLLVESNYVCHDLLKRLWGWGHVHYSKQEFESIEHAINYATKYIVKTSEADDDEFWFPDWVLDLKDSNFRRFSTSRGLCKPLRKPAKKNKTGETRERVTRSPRERSYSCGKTINVLEPIEKVWKSLDQFGELEYTTEKSYRFLGTIDSDWDGDMKFWCSTKIMLFIRAENCRLREPYVQRDQLHIDANKDGK